MKGRGFSVLLIPLGKRGIKGDFLPIIKT